MIIAQQNGRTTIGAPDRLFGVSSKAKERIAEIGKENVIDSTIGVLLGDDGNLVVLDSVMKAINSLSPEDYARYAPILGVPAYLEAVKKAVFLDGIPEGVYVEACYTPGGTGAIRNAISGYTTAGDKVLTSDWHWAPYNLVAAELGRKVETYTLFDAEDKFNADSFAAKTEEILASQDEIVIIINTPAHNPTGYTFTDEDWNKALAVLTKYTDKQIALVVDIAYLDFSGDKHEYRKFLNKLAGLPQNILPLIAFSASKGYTMYGMRCGALLCMAPTPEIAKEFKDVMSVECRASWSNGNRSAMTAVANLVNDDQLFTGLQEEREKFLAILNRRGQVFMEEAKKIGLRLCPYDSGFFVVVPCASAAVADAVGLKLQEFNIFTIVLGSGIRVSVASNTEDECRRMPAKIKEAIELCTK